MATIGERISGLFQRVPRGQRIKAPEEMGLNRTQNYQAFMPYTTAPYASGDKIFKAVIPQWFYKPPWGLPHNKDIVEIRRLAATPYVTIVRNTIANEISGLDWDVEVEEGKTVPEDVIQKTKSFLYNPNSNDESLTYIIKQLVGDSVEVDAAVLEKVHNLQGELVEIYSRDAGLFLKNPDIHGVLPPVNAYWQYSWTVGTPPIPFNREDLVYMVRNPRTDQVYGRGEVEVLYSVLRLLLYGIENNLEYFTETQTASGILKLSGASLDEIQRFKEQWRESMRKVDTGGYNRRQWWKTPIFNNDVEFVKTGFSNVELELIEQQKWFSKLVWAAFGMSPSELGFNEDVNRASAIMESASVKRKILKPFMMMIEYYFDTQVLNSLPWIKGKYEDMIHFEFDRTDLGYDKAEREVLWGDYDRNLITKNEFLSKIGMPTVEGGDVYKDEAMGAFGQTTMNTKMGPNDLNLGLAGSAKVDLRTRPENLNLGSIGSKTPEEIDHEGSFVFNPEEKSRRFDYVGIHDTAYNVSVEKKYDGLHVFINGADHGPFSDMEEADIFIRQKTGESLSDYGLKAKAYDLKSLDSSTPLMIKNFEELGKHLEGIDSDFNSALSKILSQSAETKALSDVGAIVAGILGVVDSSSIGEKIKLAIKEGYERGLEFAGIKTKQNFIPEPETMTFLQSYAYENVKGFDSAMRNDLRKTILKAYSSGLSSEKMAEEIKSTLDVSRNRAKMIAATEMNRAVNAGKLQGFKDSEVKGKVEWKAQEGVELGHACSALDGQKRSPGKLFQTKGFSGHGPPVHPNCVCTIEFVPEE